MPAMSSLMTRSGRLYSSVESREQRSIGSILSPSQDQWDPYANARSTFVELCETIDKYNIPSVEIHNPGADFITTKKFKPPSIFPLGSGSTADVVRHITGNEFDHIVPSGSVIALKKFRYRCGNVPGFTTTEADKCELYKVILREIRTFYNHHLHGHPNIAQLLFVGWQLHNPFPLLGIEFGDHGSLEFILREAKFGPTSLQKRHLTLDLVLGLSAIHRAGFIHGDLKPDNILVMAHEDPKRQLVAKMIDFGGASSDKAVHFTPLWSAPEVMNKDNDIVWAKADVYSLGLVIASLWARPKIKEFRLTLNSCILSSIAPIGVPDHLLDRILFAAKSSLSFCIKLLKLHMTECVDLGGFDTSELFDILASMLHPHFWQRQDTKCLVQDFVSFGEMLGRDIRQEDDFTEPQSTPQIARQRTYSLTMMHVLNVHIELLRESISRKKAIWANAMEPQVCDIEINIPEHDLSGLTHDEYMESLWGAAVHLFAPGRLKTNENIMDITRTIQEIAQESWTLTEVYSSSPMLSSKTVASYLMNVSAVCGSKSAMHMVALTDTGIASRARVLIYLLLLALSGSSSALQRLYIEWPSHFKIIQEIIQTKRLDYEAMKRSESLFHLRLYTLYGDAPSIIEGSTTLKRALEVGSITEIKNILDGKTIPPDLDEFLPGLLHDLSCLIDTEAGPLAKAAFERGADLTNMRPCKMPIFYCDPLEGLNIPSSQLLYCPISSAIINGKEVLAMALFCLHVDAKIPIPDFKIVLFLSFRYLQHKLCKALIGLLLENHSICCDATHSCEVNEVFLRQLFMIVISRTCSTDLERRAMHGRNFARNYEKCLQILLQIGVDPTKQLGDDTCPLVKMLDWDDSVGLNLLIQHSRQNNSNSAIFDCFPEGYKAAPLRCILFQSPYCLKLLLQNFSRLASEVLGNLKIDLLQLACICQHINALTICVLLNRRINVTTSGTKDSYFLPLFWALRNHNIPVADLIASQCGDNLNELVSRNAKGESIFSFLIRAWIVNRDIKAIDSLRWLKKHNGISSYADGGSMICEEIFLSPRPLIQSDQIRDAKLLNFLLDDSIYGKEVNKPGESGLTLIQASAFWGHIEAVKVLLIRGADVNIRSTCDGIDGMSAVDCAYHSFTKRCPGFIEAAGSSAIQEWRKDLYSIMLLLRKHADDGPATAPRLMVEAQAAFIRENISPQKVLIKDIISYIPRGKWPRQISSGTERSLRERGAQAMLESHFVSLITNISGDDFMEAQGQSSFDSKKYYETGDLELMLVELYQGFIEDGLRRLDDWKRNEPNIQNAGPCLHNIWRLPPHWAFLRISGIMQVDYFIDLRSQRVVHKKPPLYCGGDDETRVSGLKGKGEDAAIDHWSSKHSYIDLTIYPSTAQDAANSKINISCCWVDMRGDLGSMSRDHDDTLAKMIVESLGEIFRATIESRKMENFKAMMDLVGHIMFWDAEGLTPLRRAAVHNQYDMVRVIIDRSRQLGRLWFRSPLVLQTMIEERNSAMTDILLEAGADPNGIVPDGIPPLHFCLSQHDAPEIVGVLIRKGADIRVRSPEGTPLEIATSCDRQLSLEVLKEAMENTGIDNSHGNTLSQHPVQTSETSTTLAISESRCCESASPDTAIISHDSSELSTERTTHESSPDHSLNG